MGNILIVESENDKYFIEGIINHINLDIKIEEPICSIDEYECLGGIGKLKERLEALNYRVISGEIDRVGIIFDADKEGVEKRTQDIETEIGFFIDNLPNEFKKIVKFSIYIMNKNGFGELETVLKEIKSKDSIIADCLDSWQGCLPEDKKLNQKEFDKFWTQIHQRYDCCSKKEAKQAGRKCNNEVSFSKGIYDLDNPILKDLKEFLQEIGAENE